MRLGGNFPSVHVIPHGIGRDRFFPFPELVNAALDSKARAKAKQQMFPDLPSPDDFFVVLNASRPDRRKMAEVSAEGVVQSLDNLYRDPNHCRELAQAAFHAAQNPVHSWDTIAQQFEQLFVDLF